jgi:putative heme-binding domain-containing protein
LKPASLAKIRLGAALLACCACAAAVDPQPAKTEAKPAKGGPKAAKPELKPHKPGGKPATAASKPASTAPSPPKCPPDWKAEVIAESPQIFAPSVVCCSPDGRVFMGEDPVDMGSPSDATADKILAIYPDGQVLTFATNLHAVFGMEYMDGKLYVHHTPFFSVFEDFHGVGVNRVDIITNDNPHPWAPTFNDHIPSGFRLAMDGYFYFTTGDKGILGAEGLDGRKIDIHGGGMFRMRPNGTGLEVYCTGTRNHLEAAINSEDEMFTFDNTDDGGGWWKRVTHMVDGGYYGYPYDFKPQRPYTLWRMDEYGGGAPTGACAYDEDALPDEYKGNLFLCDWEGEIFRLKVSRSGSTYKIDDKTVFMSKGESGEFKPVGICVSPDGKSLYVTDWGHSYWKRDEKMGRLVKVTYTGKTQEAPKPAWFLPAATGEKFEATTAELVRGLIHPAESVRKVAQRRLAERGSSAARAVLKLLKDGKAPSYARWFAIWTLDALDGGKKERKAIMAALKDKDITVEMQAARELGTRSVRQAAPALTVLLKSTNAALRFRASTALGRIGDRAAVPALMKELNQKDLFARYAAFVALRRIGLADPKAWPEIVEGFANTNAAIREGVGFAVRETYDPALANALAAFSARTNLPSATRTNVLGLLSSVSMKQPPWKGDWWSIQPVHGSPTPKTIDWAGTPIVASALHGAIRDRDAAVRKIGIAWVHSSHDTNAAVELAELFQHETDLSARVGIVHELAAIPGKPSQAVITSILQDPRAPNELLLAAVDAAGKMPGSQWNENLIALAQKTKDERVLSALFDFYANKKLAAAVPMLVTNLAQSSKGLGPHAVDALKAIGDQAAIDGLIANMSNPDADRRSRVITALGDMKAKSAVPALIKVAAASDTHEAALEALAKMPDLAALDIYLDGLASKNASLRKQCETAVRALQKQALPLLEARLATNNLPTLALTSLKQIYQNDPTAKKSSLFRRKVLETPVAQYQEFALAHTGDPRRGKALFHDLKGIACIRCHRIDAEGGDIGPDLAGIHAKYPRAFIIESVLYPSKVILDGYQQVFFQTKDDEEVGGIVRNETPDDVTVIDTAGEKHVLKKSNITSRKVSQISLMPEGLQSGLSVTEFSDLISYVENPILPEPPKPPSLAGASRKSPAFDSDPNLRPGASAPVPEPGADLFSLLDVPGLPEEPMRSTAAVRKPPPAIRPNHVPPAPWPILPPPPARTMPTRTRPAPPPVADDSSPPRQAPPLPPMPPGLKPTPPAPPEN